MRQEVYCLHYDINDPSGAMTLSYRGRIIVRDGQSKLYNAGGSRWYSTLTGACVAIDREAV